MTEGELAQAAARGDQNAAREIVRRYGRMVRTVVSRCARRDPHLVDDLVQDVWLAVFKAIDQYDPAIAKLSTWIGAIAAHGTAHRNVRRRLARDRSVIPLELERGDEAGDRYPSLLEMQASPNPGALEQMERLEAVRMIEAVRSRLPERQAQIVGWYLDGVEPGDMVRRLGCSRANVNSLLHLASGKIRFLLPYLRRSPCAIGGYTVSPNLPN